MLFSALFVAAACTDFFPEADPKQVTATVQTSATGPAATSADDPALWIHPTDPEKSLILGTNKDAGLVVYSLDGQQMQFLADGKLKNVSVRQRVAWSGPMGKPIKVDLAVASSVADASLYVYRIDRRERTLSKIAAIKTSLAECEALGLYCPPQGPHAGELFAAVGDRAGAIEVWRLEPLAAGVAGTLVRQWSLKSAVSSIVADDDQHVLYIAEKARGIWRFAADAAEIKPNPDGSTPTVVKQNITGTLIDEAAPKGRIAAPVQGLALYRGVDSSGYLLASAQAASEFLVYRREGQNAYLGRFAIAGTPTIDAVQRTVGIDVTSVQLGALFPFGAFIAQDSDVPGKRQNFKVVAWDTIAKAFEPPLQITPTH